MAIVRQLNRITIDHKTQHTELAECTYSIVEDDDGRKCLQIDTYGSTQRKIQGKKSQSLRFSPEALTQLRQILSKEL